MTPFHQALPDIKASLTIRKGVADLCKHLAIILALKPALMRPRSGKAGTVKYAIICNHDPSKRQTSRGDLQ